MELVPDGAEDKLLGFDLNTLFAWKPLSSMFDEICSALGTYDTASVKYNVKIKGEFFIHPYTPVVQPQP